MKNTRMMWAVLALSAGGPLLAQSPGAIHGKLLDEANVPIPFTSVSARQGERVYTAESDEDGRFVLKPLPPGAYEVRVVAMNVDRTVDGVIVDADKITFLPDLTFTTAYALDPMQIIRVRDIWTPPLIDRERPEVIGFFHTQLKHDATRKDFVKMLDKKIPGVTKAPHSDELYFRGARSGAMCYYVDGVKAGSGNPGVPPDAINSIQVYTGGIPAKYGDLTGGVVAIETKSYFDLYQQRNAGIR